jgi:hypothetical protein
MDLLSKFKERKHLIPSLPSPWRLVFLTFHRPLPVRDALCLFPLHSMAACCRRSRKPGSSQITRARSAAFRTEGAARGASFYGADLNRLLFNNGTYKMIRRTARAGFWNGSNAHKSSWLPPGVYVYFAEALDLIGISVLMYCGVENIRFSSEYHVFCPVRICDCVSIELVRRNRLDNASSNR